MKNNLKTLKDYAEEIQDLVLLQIAEDFEAELEEMAHVNMFGEKIVIVPLKEILGET